MRKQFRFKRVKIAIIEISCFLVSLSIFLDDWIERKENPKVNHLFLF